MYWPAILLTILRTQRGCVCLYPDWAQSTNRDIHRQHALWRNQMETLSAYRVTGEFPAQRLVTQSFDVFFDLRLNKRLSKQSWCWWFETPSHSLWRHCNDGWLTLLAASPEDSIYYRLTETLLSNYSSDVFPMTDPSQPVEVAIGMTLNQIVDMVSSLFNTPPPPTRWPPFRKRHFQMHFREWKVL